MARTFHLLYLPDISLADASNAEVRIVNALQSLGLLSSRGEARIDEFGRQIHRYGVAETASKLFRKNEPDAFGLGGYIESTVGRYANGWSLNLAEQYDCPLCESSFRFDSDAKPFDEIARAMQRAIILFIDTGKPSEIQCPACRAAVEGADWRVDVPAAMSHLAFEFSQFPPFNSNIVSIPARLFGYGEWLVDVPSAMQAAAAQPIGWSMGRV